MNVAHFPLIREVNKRQGPVMEIMHSSSRIPGNLRLTTALVAGIRQHRKYSDMVVWGERSKATKSPPDGKKYFVKSDNQVQKFDLLNDPPQFPTRSGGFPALVGQGRM